MTDDPLDDFDEMDRIQDDTNAMIDGTIPFEPSVEVRDETPHGEPMDADICAADEAPCAAVHEFGVDLSAPEFNFQADILEGFDL